jgi:hypothetical protein
VNDCEVSSNEKAILDVSRGDAVHSTDDDGKQKIVTERLDLPPDVANGMVLTLLKNIRSDASQTKVSIVAATPKPRLVKLATLPKARSRSRSVAPVAKPRTTS